VFIGRLRAGSGAGVGAEDLGDRGAVGRRVAGDALQRIQPAQPHRQRLLVVELVDRFGEAIGELALLAELELVPAGRGGLPDLPEGYARADGRPGQDH